MSKLKEPTAKECEANALVFETEFRKGYAIWYPQMGGYIGKAIAMMDKSYSVGEGGCVDVHVWHDGEFPFKGEGESGGNLPTVIHHCSPGGFISFGQKLEELNEKGLKEECNT